MSIPLALGVLAVVIVVAASSGSPAADRRVVRPQVEDSPQHTYALFTGIPQHGTVLGYPNARVTLQFFADLQCPESRQMMLGALPYLIRHWVRSGKLQIRFRSTQAETYSWYEFRDQQVAALAAGKQDKLWNFVDVFFREQKREFSQYADEEFLDSIAEQAGVDLARWEADRPRFQETWVDRIESEEHLAKRKGLAAAPAFLIGPTGRPGHALRHFSLEEPTVFDEAIKEALQGLPPTAA